jgi:LysR family transcriptional activator of nhaA
MPFLNYHHLRYFRVIARELSVTRAAEKLNLSVPALSIQLKQLEESLGHKLFERGKGGLVLTEAGRLALDYADTIGRTGEELMAVMQQRPQGGGRQVLRVGAVATLSRNFQLEFLRPALHRAAVEVVIRSGALRELLMALHAHEVDLVLSNQPARRDAERPWHSHLLAEQPVSLVGVPAWKKKKLKFPQDFRDVPVTEQLSEPAGFLGDAYDGQGNFRHAEQGLEMAGLLVEDDDVLHAPGFLEVGAHDDIGVALQDAHQPLG